MPSFRGACLLASLAGVALGAVPPGIALIQVQSPQSLKGAYRGYFSYYSMPVPPEGPVAAYAPIGNTSGCSPWEAPRGVDTMAVVSTEGDCSLQQKLENAQAAGVKGVMVVSADDIINMSAFNDDTAPGDGTLDIKWDIFVFQAASELGAQLLHHGPEHGDEPVRLTVAIYKGIFPLADPSVLILVALAVSLIALGAWFNTRAQSADSQFAPTSSEEVMLMEWQMPFMWVIGASCTLVVLYFLMKWLIYLVLFVFGAGGVGTITQIGHVALSYMFPALKMKVKACKDAELSLLIAGTIGVSVSLSWFFLRKTAYAWPFQNIIGICFLCFFQRSIHLPNIKLAASLLSMMFCFDIFWVFVSPMFFAQSVMVAVAMGGGSGEVAPMLLRIPAFTDPLGSDRMLGYGDIAVPGLLVSMLLRFDILHGKTWRKGYFVPAVIGYAVGLCCALVGLYLMQMGQPALLYLVPGTLGTTSVLACKRRELKALWSWDGSAGESLLGDLSTRTFCNRGHALHSRRASTEELFPGKCDHCGVDIQPHALVMDCRVCNWYVCTACRPQPEAQEAPAEAPAAAQS